MKNLVKLFLFGLALFLTSCNDDINRYQIVNNGNSSIIILDTKEGIYKEFAKGKVTIINFKENEAKRIPLNLYDIKD